ncbi:MAG: hypothetical protein ACQER7_11110 [Bacteroidota bacterium]
MKALRFLKWTPIVMAGVFVISSQNNFETQKPIKLTYKYLKDHTWISVNEKGRPTTANHQTCKLIFLEDQDFELRKTFEYSGSTLKTPGRFILQDSIIHLKNLSGSQKVGKAYIHKGYQLRIEWDHPNSIYGRGTETFQQESTLTEKSYSQEFSTRMLDFLNID